MNIPFENTEHRDHDEHTVLIIDDEPANLRVMSDYLSSFGLEALVARDGETGIEKAQYAQPDLILLDVLMPGIDGFETCRRLKANEVLRDIPVLFMTALTETQDKVKGFDVGGVDYITKPFQVEEVLARVKTHLVLHTMQKQLEAQNAQLQQEMARRWQAESQREAVLEALRESEELHRLTLASISDAVFLTDDTGVFTFICPNVHIIFGYSVQEVRALGNITRLVGEGLFVPAKLEALGEIENIERDITDKAGDVHSLLVSVKRVSIRGGTRLYACRDITERKRAEEALQEAHDELEQRVVERTAELAQANIKLKEEITERKRAESHREAALEALRGSEQRYHSLFEDMPLALWEENYFQVKAYLENLLASGVTDLRAYFENHPEAAADCAGLVQVLDVNKAAVALVGGRDKEQLLARLPEGFTATSLQAFGEQLVTLAEGGREFESEATYRKLTGEEQVVLLHLSVAPGHESSLGRVLVSMLDVTERRQAEKALQESEERYRTLFEGVPIGLYRTTPAGQILDANPALVHMLGYPDRESLLAADVIDLYVNPQDRQQWQALAKKEGGVHDFEVQLRRHDGRTIWVWDSARAVYDAEGQTLYYEGSQEDVTERKRAEEALRASEQKFRNVVEQSQDGILLTDEQGQVMEWNRRQEQITGLERAEVLGQPLWDIQFRMVPEERRTPAIYTGFELNSLELLQGGHPSWLDQLLETTIQLPDGRQRIIQSVVFPIKTDKRVMIGSINRDITEQKKAEEALRRRVTQLVLINEIGGRIAAEFELDGVLDAAARLVQESFGYSRVALFTVDHTRKEAVMKARSGSYNPLLPPDYRLKLGRGMVGWVAAHGEKLLANHVAAEPRYINAYPELIPTQSELSVPIRVGEQIVGVLDAQSPELDAFDENDVLVMETVAGQIAVAIEDARLYEAIQRELTERRRAEEALRLERDLAVTLSSTSDLREALNELLEIGLEVEGIDCGGAYLVDALTGALDQVVHRGLSPEFVETVSHFGSDSPQARLILAGKPVHQVPSQLLPELEDQAREREGLRAIAIVPVFYRGQVVAALNLASHTHASLSLQARNVVEAIASQAGGFIARLTAERALRESEEKFRGLVKRSSDGIVLIDEEGTILEWNRGQEQITGLEQVEVLSQPFWEVSLRITPEEQKTSASSEEVKARILAALRTGQAPWLEQTTEQEIQRPDGTRRTIQTRVFPIKTDKGFMAGSISRDVTEQKLAERMLLQSEKLAAMGKLAASVAHEVNNPLQSVQGCLTLAEEELAGSQRRERLERYLGIATGEIERIAEIVRRMRDFYRPPVTGMQPTDVHAVLQSVLELSGKQLQHSNITVEHTWADDLPAIRANPDHLKQVFLNLVLNAIDAMPGGGTLRLRTVRHHMPSRGDQPPQPAVYVEFSDTGKGMSLKTQARLFEPFFTTKEHGSGLGLYISHGIVSAHQGQINVMSYEGLGSTFSILLPVKQRE